MRRTLLTLALLATALLALTPAARAAFGVSEFDVTFTGPEGETVTQAGSHPYQMQTRVHFNSHFNGEGTEELEGAIKDVFLTQMKGFVGNPSAVPRCPDADFLTVFAGSGQPSCPDSAVLGTVAVELPENKDGTTSYFGAVYNLNPPPGKAAKLGFWIAGFPITVELGVAESPPYNILGGPTNIAQVVEVASSTFTLWGNPAAEAHDSLRGHCLGPNGESTGEKCPANISEVPFLTLPRACEGPLKTTYAVDAWQDPGAKLPSGVPDLSDPAWVTGFSETHNSVGAKEGFKGCGKLGFGPEIGVAPTTSAAESASGLELEINVADEGLLNPAGNAQADIQALEIALPAGVTVNPSAAEGLGVCSLAQFGAASLQDPGCPQASKLGTLAVSTPILEGHVLRGSFYLAAQNENPFGSLLAAYLMIRDPELGVFVKLAAEITTDEATGQIITTVKELPPFPLEKVKVNLRPGPRAPLITPPSCDSDPSPTSPGNDPYTTEATLTPSSGAAPLHTTSSFAITSGPGGGPCPTAGTPPFDPGFEAGTLNNAASTFAPFYMRLTRRDGQQDLTRFSATLPPGVSGKIAGLGKCPDAAIDAAKLISGRQELAAPSCPAASKLGNVLAGAGVGSSLTYATGSLYLAGPYHGAPLSVAAIVPAVAGPFDLGTIITRVALNLNPTSAQVEIDGAASDPIPHILKGIPLKVRDIRVAADRPDFTLNPTSCAEFKTTAQIFGSGTDPFNPADDSPLGAEARFQAASCASLAFKPKLSIVLKGGTRRNDHPALYSSVTYPYPSGPGYANVGRAQITLPHSEFIDPEHINNPCTRVQFNADACPPTSVLGTAKAISPLLDEPLQGPVYFRSNGGERKVPDIVADLHGLVDIVLVGFVDSKNARIRTTFENVPDAPVTSFSLNLFGGKKKGVIVNSANLCAHKRHLKIALRGQNGRRYDTEPALVASGCKKAGAGKGQKRRR